MSLIKITKSLCPVCLNTISAKIIPEDSILYLLKECPEHGIFKARHPWGNMRYYDILSRLNIKSSACDFADGLIINLNSDCNQNCPFCFAMANEYKLKEPNLYDIQRMIKSFKGSSVYLCGGEPTMRKDIFEIIAFVKKSGYKVFLFTNGKSFLDINYAKHFKKSGIDMIILQFDTFDEDQNELIRGERLVRKKLLALGNLREANIPAYLFVMLINGVNFKEIGALIKYTVNNSDLIKIINFNPVWEIGRLGSHKELDASDILQEIERQTQLKFQDFAECTFFSYYLSELVRKITKKGGRKHPMCEMRCYIISDLQSFIPLNKILNLVKINEHLKKLNEIISDEKGLKKMSEFLLKACSLLLSIIKDKYTIKSVIIIAMKILYKKFHKGSKFNLISIIVGTFHTEKNIDLDMVSTCNLFSESVHGNISSCLRQIYYLKEAAFSKISSYRC